MKRFDDIFTSRQDLVFRSNRFVVTAVSLLLLLTSTVRGRVHSQARDATANPLTYEIVSIRPSAPNSDPNSGGTEELADGYKATNVTLLTLIRRAYGIDVKSQILGTPGWLSSDAYDIQAKMESSVADDLRKLSPLERTYARQQMLRALLADRFKLVVHRENRELPVYMLVVAKNGLRLHESTPERTPNEIHDSSLDSGRRGGKITAPCTTTQSLAGLLSIALNRTVLDKTGLTAKYDIALQWSVEQEQAAAPRLLDGAQAGTGGASMPDASWPSIFTAIQEQLGLKLEPGKGPVKVVVIDHVERPSGN
jgi:uncharacterized protein (TIGR03435 family)